jgi:hypothetical protein
MKQAGWDSGHMPDDEARKQFRFKCPHRKKQFIGQQAPKIIVPIRLHSLT